MNRVQVKNFKPMGDSVTLSATATTASDQFLGPDSPDKVIRVVNAGADNAFIEIGGAAVAAVVATSLPLLANTEIYLSAPHDEGDYLAAICAATETATIYVTPGIGGS